MESMLSKLRDTVSATVYQVTSNLSTALPGNPLTREYELIKQIGSGGPGLIFKIYEATKKSTKENVSLWIFEKKTEKLSKKEKEILFETIRHGVQQLTRLRHPSMLTVQHNMEESRDLIAFATEPVIGSLANFLDKNFVKDILKEDQFEFYDIEIKYGLLQVSEGLLFLHKDAKILHRNICPDNIIVNRNGIWKIAGFDFSIAALDPNVLPLKFPTIKIIPDLSLDIQPNYTYSAPEMFDESSSIEASADIFSLGMMAYSLYNKGKPLLKFDASYQFRAEKFIYDIKQAIQQSSNLTVIPEDFCKHLKLLLSIDPQLRPDAQQFSKMQIFQDVLVRTLQYFDSLFQWDNTQKSQFYRNLPDILPRIPKRVKLRRIVNGLAKEFVNPEMVPFVLPPIFLIAKETDDEEFHIWILPELVQIFRYKEPIQIGIYLLKNMDFLVEKFKSKPESLKEHILPLIYRFLESNAYQIQELCLSVLPSIIHLVDFSGCKNMLMPRIKRLTLETKLLSVRVNCLIALGKILEHLDKWLVLDEVLPLLMMIPSKEPAVIMCSVGIITLTLNSNKLGISKEILANKIIPFLVPLSIENGLSLQQYAVIMNLIRDILNRIEEEHITKLKQLDSIKIEQDSLVSQSNAFENFEKGEQISGPNFKADWSSNFLSLDEKEQLAFQQEQSEKFKNEKLLVTSPIEPISKGQFPVPTSLKNKPKDLTDQLVNSNLDNFIQNKPKITNLMDTHPNSVNLFVKSNSIQSSNEKKTLPNSFDSLKLFDSIPKISQPMNSFVQSSPMQQSLGSLGMMINTSSTNMPSTTMNQNSVSTKPLSQKELDEFLN
ncbi:SCY1-like protein 2 [Sarcoptes scabiei]|uniref:SCY1-like protein 2 n=1 Tax=Sarcoptes scabiei TaxID=52283 RepID=A0A834R407_SARSC|nr:SCY1-like protein 2 [Sarcoptes scabiei]